MPENMDDLAWQLYMRYHPETSFEDAKSALAPILKGMSSVEDIAPASVQSIRKLSSVGPDQVPVFREQDTVFPTRMRDLGKKSLEELQFVQQLRPGQGEISTPNDFELRLNRQRYFDAPEAFRPLDTEWQTRESVGEILARRLGTDPRTRDLLPSEGLDMGDMRSLMAAAPEEQEIRGLLRRLVKQAGERGVQGSVSPAVALRGLAGLGGFAAGREVSERTGSDVLGGAVQGAGAGAALGGLPGAAAGGVIGAGLGMLPQENLVRQLASFAGF